MIVATSLRIFKAFKYDFARACLQFVDSSDTLRICGFWWGEMASHVTKSRGEKVQMKSDVKLEK